MVPRSIQRQLNRLRRRERLLRLTWAAARGLAVAAAVLAAACLVDFVVDLYRDTPQGLRVGLLAGQAALWLTALALVARSAARRISDTQVALWVEEKLPSLGHRLISAVQLNRADAATEGMSPEMIAAVTRQAEEQAAAARFARLADARRLRWSAALLAPPAVAFGLAFALWPDTARALLSRQMLDDRPIPRSLALESANPYQVWPAGEEGVLRFRVRGAFAESLRGEVRLESPDGERERHELVYESADDDGTATFVARVPPRAHDFTYSARLRDGRTRQPAEVHLEPRPVVQRLEAWVRLPASVGLKPDGRPYEEPQKGADIVYRLNGSGARIAVETQKPIARATVELLASGGRQPPVDANRGLTPPARQANEAVHRSVELTVQDGGRRAEGVVAFPPGTPPETAYRVVVRDEFGLDNRDRPRRGIRTGPVDPPEVALLPETLSPADGPPTEDDEIEGIPILIGQRVPIAYECKAAYGLSHARLRYRVIARSVSRDDENEPQDKDFLPLPLGARYGKGKPGDRTWAEFYTKAPDDPDRIDGTEGGGHYDFDTAGIPDGKGGLLKLAEGDRLQFYVEVFGRADADGTPGRSTVREKEVVSQKDFWAWVEKKEDHKERIRQLEQKQRDVAAAPSLLPDERPHASAPRPADPLRPGTPNDLEGVFGRSWQLLGPFPNEKDEGHAQAFPPETQPTDLAREYDGLSGKVRWRSHQSTTDKIDLQEFFSHGEAGVAYAVCWVKPNYPTRAVVSAGSDDGIKVWVNRKLVLDRAVHREAVPGEDRTPVTLENGWQEILVKVDNRFGSWAFYLDLLDPATGRPFTSRRLSVRTTAPEGKPPDVRPRPIPFVKGWLLLGPFGAPTGQVHARAFPPEGDAVDLRREYDGKRGKVRWRGYHSPEDKIDFQKAFSLREADAHDCAAYAVVWVRSAKKRPALLLTGSDDGIKVWLNRKIVLDKPGARGAVIGQDRTAVELNAGWNELRIKIDNWSGEWSLYAQLGDPAGGPLTDVEYRTTPPR